MATLRSLCGILKRGNRSHEVTRLVGISLVEGATDNTDMQRLLKTGEWAVIQEERPDTALNRFFVLGGDFTTANFPDEGQALTLDGLDHENYMSVSTRRATLANEAAFASCLVVKENAWHLAV